MKIRIYHESMLCEERNAEQKRRGNTAFGRKDLVAFVKILSVIKTIKENTL